MRPQLLLAAITLLGGARAQSLYATDFTTAQGWTFSTSLGACHSAGGYTWAVDATPGSHLFGPYRSAPASLNFNDGFSVGPAFGGVACGTATSAPLDLSAATGDVYCAFWFSYQFNQASACTLDSVSFDVLDAMSGATLAQHCLPVAGQSTLPWQRLEFLLDRAWGSVALRFSFYGGPGVGFNDPSGPFIDDLEVYEVCAPFQSYCVTSPNTASALGARIGALGSGSVAANSLRLYALDTATSTFAIFFYGDTRALVPSGNGAVCIGGQTFRLPAVATGAAGTPSWSLDLTAPPSPTGRITPGSTWRFQCWFRDGNSWNFSDGLEIAFCP
ncbi:MAG: hypothetical protein R3F49_21410 [Planctomycetota bacterium]